MYYNQDLAVYQSYMGLVYVHVNVLKNIKNKPLEVRNIFKIIFFANFKNGLNIK